MIDQKLLQRQLTKAGLAVLTANNGLEALDRLHKAAADNIKIDVCLMDLGQSLGQITNSWKFSDLVVHIS